MQLARPCHRRPGEGGTIGHRPDRPAAVARRAPAAAAGAAGARQAAAAALRGAGSEGGSGCNSGSDGSSDTADQQQQRRRGADGTGGGVSLPSVALAAVAAAAAIAGRAGAARAEAAEWKPRRHHRHIGERFTDTWADAIVEVQEAERQTIRDLRQQLQQEKRRADDEAAKRKVAEQTARAAVLQQAARAADDDALLSVRVLGADVTVPLTLALLAAGGYYAWSTDLVGRLTGRKGFGRRGRWVYDRSLGGKKVWVPESDEGAAASLPVAGADIDFEALAAAAASKAGGAGGSGAVSAAEYEPPAWWERPGVLPVASEAERTARRDAAERILRRIEAAKNRGEDYDLEAILALRSACMNAGGATLETRTVGARDAIYKAAVDAGIKACLEPGSVDLGGYTPVRLAAGVASDVGLPEQRAVSVLAGAVAGASRMRIVEAIATLEKGDDMGALMALAQLASLLEGVPALGPASPEVELVAGELNTWATVVSREKILVLMLQIDEGKADLVARLLDFRPEEALPRARAALEGTRSGGDGSGGGV